MATTLSKGLSKNIPKIVPFILGFKQNQLIFDYDREADVLYLSFKHPQQATESELLPNDIIINYRKNEVVGITILNARERYGK